MLETLVFGFKSIILNVVIVVVLLLKALPFTGYTMVYWIRIPLSCEGASQVKCIEYSFGVPTKLRTIVGPANHRILNYRVVSIMLDVGIIQNSFTNSATYTGHLLYDTFLARVSN